MSELYCYNEDRKEPIYKETSRVYTDHKKRTVTIHREYPFTLDPKLPKVKVVKLVFTEDEAYEVLEGISNAWNKLQ